MCDEIDQAQELESLNIEIGICVQRGTGQKLWWDGMQKYQDKEQLLPAFSSDFDERVDTVAERRLVPAEAAEAVEKWKQQ
ncbi:hypothetical protein [Yersinia rohdei]|uniref:hypothetical protein n=1 Tax=Yersinia rohdei TaxID=29485 RepID=UPI0025AA9AFD|nr:hypothetical protein [Yersinia rohdei]MDN0093475.1 hypothetical protein [Yersinia rohdei]